MVIKKNVMLEAVSKIKEHAFCSKQAEEPNIVFLADVLAVLEPLVVREQQLQKLIENRPINLFYDEEDNIVFDTLEFEKWIKEWEGLTKP